MGKLELCSIFQVHYISEAVFHTCRILAYLDKTAIASKLFKLGDALFVVARLSSVTMSVLTFWFGLASVPAELQVIGIVQCTLIIPTLVSGPPTCERCCSFVSLFFPSPLVAELKSEQLVPGVGHRHWELQHPLGETRSPPGRLPPASLAYVWLDHVPGETLASYSIFWGLHKYSPS